MESFIAYSSTILQNSKTMKKPYILLTPGPVILTSQIKNILSEQPHYHRGLKFQQIFNEVKKNLQTFFQTKEAVIILTSTGTGAMEAAITNTLSPGDTVLCICSGKFGNRWRDIALSYGLKAETIDVPWGEAVSPEEISRFLQKNTDIKALLISSCETSTATNQPIKEISQILKNNEKILFIVDGITGLGSMDLPMDQWNIDVLVGGSQKSFLLPTGMAFIALSQKAWNFEKKSRCPKYYFNLKREKEDQDKGQTSFSINVSFIKALQESFKHLLGKDKNLKKCISKCQQLAKATHLYCKELNLDLLSKQPSASVTAIKIPKNISANQIKKSIEEKENIIIAGGQDHLKDKIIRIGHLGFIQNEDFLRCLESLGIELHNQSTDKFPKNKIQKALEVAKKELSKGF